MTRGFLSDNSSGVHPAVLAALAAANDGHVPSYGADPVTAALEERVRDLFGPDAQVFPVFNGTGANVVALKALLQPWEAAVATAESHMVTDESTAPQLVGGMRLVSVPSADGKATPALLAPAFDAYDGTVHHARPAAITLAESTELGTTYDVAELAELTAFARAHGARVHLDGARLANAAARLGTSLRAVTTDVGVDVLSFGGTKNGALLGDAVIVLDPVLAEPVARLRKAATQLASKTRFVSAQLLALLTDDLWRRNAAHANAAADLLGGAPAGAGRRARLPGRGQRGVPPGAARGAAGRGGGGASPHLGRPRRRGAGRRVIRHHRGGRRRPGRDARAAPGLTTSRRDPCCGPRHSGSPISSGQVAAPCRLPTSWPSDRGGRMSVLAVETSGLRKSYRGRGGRRAAVQDLDLHVPAGGVHGFLGPNGSGKTTTHPHAARPRAGRPRHHADLRRTGARAAARGGRPRVGRDRGVAEVLPRLLRREEPAPAGRGDRCPARPGGARSSSRPGWATRPGTATTATPSA